MNTAVQPAFDTTLTGRYQALSQVSRALMSHRSQEDLPQTLSSELRQVMDFYYLGVGLFDAEAHEVDLRLFDETGTLIPLPHLATEETLTWWVYQEQRPLVIPSVEEEVRFPASIKLLKEHGVHSVCVLPLTTAHRRIGVLSMGSKEQDAFSKQEVCFLTLVANQVALALDDARNFQASERAQGELQRERDRLHLLLELTNQVVSNLELRDLLRSISSSIRFVMSCDAAAVLLPEDGSRDLRVYALDFSERRCLVQEGDLVSIDNSPLGPAFRSGKPLVMGPEDLRKAYPESAAPGKDEWIKAKCVIPLLSRDRCIGILILVRSSGNNFSEDEIRFLVQVAGQVSIAVENARAYQQIADLKDQLTQEKLYLEDEIRSELNFEEIIGESETLRKVLRQVETVAPTDSTVLIYGETGTGKELIARAIHMLSSRQSSAFVKLNCAAIPTGLLESELFGHEKGAFTGAISQRIGRFELAHRGTIFLDEVGEIPLELQPKLLRVLQEREFERLGSTRTLRTDARLIAATNRDLASLVEEQKFRGDLFYRLNVFPVYVPALRERSEDVPLLVRHFAQQFSRRMNKTIHTIPAGTMDSLSRYHWPGNVRELQNVIERAVILSKGSVLSVSLPELKRPVPGAQPGAKVTLEEAERKHILSVLETTNWVVGGQNGAAAHLGLNRSTLQFRMRKLGLARPTRTLSAAPSDGRSSYPRI